MPKKKSRDVEKDYPKARFVEKLRRLADAIENDERFVISIAGQRIHVPARAQFNLEHERSASGEEIEFQIKWNPAKESATSRLRVLRISAAVMPRTYTGVP